jgi:hypothetical protein
MDWKFLSSHNEIGCGVQGYIEGLKDRFKGWGIGDRGLIGQRGTVMKT